MEWVKSMIGLRSPDRTVPGKLKVVCLSDTHNKLWKFKVPQGDILLHSGDFTNVGSPSEIENFAKEIQALKFKHKVIIAGNHELTLDPAVNKAMLGHYIKAGFDREALKNRLKTAATYLEHEAVTIEGIRIFGSPFTPEFGGWAFNYNKKNAVQVWKDMPECDVLLTHGPPHGILDRTTDGVKAGCPELLRRVRELKPKLHLFGHIHEGHGVLSQEGTTFVNGSSVNFSYAPVNSPVILFYDPETGQFSQD